MIILIMGLSGTGKTTMADSISKRLSPSSRLNADTVRREYNDWDFSEEGRERQAKRLRRRVDALDKSFYNLVDFIAPTERTRSIFGADYTIWMDTYSSSKYRDTDELFTAPSKFNVRVTSWSKDWLDKIVLDIEK